MLTFGSKLRAAAGIPFEQNSESWLSAISQAHLWKLMQVLNVP